MRTETRRELRAGPLAARLDGIDLRSVSVGGVEVVRRLYVAVRDSDWNTIAPEVERLDVRERDGAFAVELAARHRSGDLEFRWEGRYEGHPDGRLECSLEGEALSGFLYNRIGFCILHPSDDAGRPFRARTPDGEVEDRLPELIGPQRVVDGHYVGLFPPFDRLALEHGGGEVVFELEGDLFEMEDQRNWTDASFKTYSTPLALGFPHRATRGQRIAQRVTALARGLPAGPAGRPAPRVELGAPLGRRLPAVGLQAGPRELGAGEAELLRALRLDHLRVDVHVAGGWREPLERARRDAAALGVALEVAVFAREGDGERLREVAHALSGARVARVLAFEEGARTSTPTETTRPEIARVASEALGGLAPVGGGSDMYFTEINRTRPGPELASVAFSVNPQVHAFDDASLMETVSMHAVAVRSARALAGDRPVNVTPVTLRPRGNPHAAAGSAEPPPPDPRQGTQLAAAWTLGSLAHLAAAGAASVTYHETAGARGVVDAGRPLPVHAALALAAELKDAELRETRVSDPLAVAALAGGDVLLLANLTPVEQRVEVAGRADPVELGPYETRRL